MLHDIYILVVSVLWWLVFVPFMAFFVLGIINSAVVGDSTANEQKTTPDV